MRHAKVRFFTSPECIIIVHAAAVELSVVEQQRIEAMLQQIDGRLIDVSAGNDKAHLLTVAARCIGCLFRIIRALESHVTV